MARVTSTALLVSGALLLVTWLVSPASSSPQAPPPAAVAPGAIEPMPPELQEVNAQVERLRIRLDRGVEYPAPARDPFHFVVRAPSRPVAVVPPPEMFAPESIAPLWPTLVAILTSAEDGSFQAALADRDDAMHVVSSGAAAGTFTVTEITADAVTIADSVSGLSTRLSLR